MNSAEWRRLFIVGAGSLVLVVAAVALVATVLDGDASEVAPGQAQTAVSGPRVGRDHWHASYEIWVCDEQQPTDFQWEGGVHTHADGIIHIHPFHPPEEGRGARLVKWFEYGGGLLTQDRMRIPGTSVTLSNGDLCRDGRPGRVHVYVNGTELDDWSEYIPQDGDRIIILFGVAGPLARLP